ncbi:MULTISPECIES: YbaB/EbfC family nucleoid-associated protein [unclassified Rhodococcus (in: high G+C Gram-positive bacteria)]|uniref:YbaB/EbfC family nucleoid-associated protein n=1 Tax=unclassified Rhodococcus (in: high G+C Gram-positive bacteria) TaxID=192944 RepID=UPI000E0A89B2|nr:MULTISPECIES: YbaB/EbfC family nucleoid-associated protein [unclassified Rhodococcus (in: high G+C Gram-positive bacteria)]QKT13342.1 YbaB/EbfC family nucleoid-associated protein [Rhodococcus sp. W8901]RDI18907.1 YbaB/EbfC DNA-binding family protein [Rhodococcus sp. AG1013]
MIDSGFEEFGAKVRRAQDVVERLRGRAGRDGVTIEVDAGNRLTAIELAPETMHLGADRLAELIRSTFAGAVADLQPRMRQALAEVTDDPQVAGLNRWIRSQGPEAAPRPSSCRDDTDEPSYLDQRGGSIFER